MKARNAKLKSEGRGLGLCGLMGPTTLINNPEKLFSYRFYKPFFFQEIPGHLAISFCVCMRLQNDLYQGVDNFIRKISYFE